MAIKKRTKNILVILAVFLILFLSAFAITKFKPFQQAVTGLGEVTKIGVPKYANAECVPDPAGFSSQSKSLNANNWEFTCDKYKKSCIVNYNIPKIPTFSDQNYLFIYKCNLDKTNCQLVEKREQGSSMGSISGQQTIFPQSLIFIGYYDSIPFKSLSTSLKDTSGNAISLKGIGIGSGVGTDSTDVSAEIKINYEPYVIRLKSADNRLSYIKGIGCSLPSVGSSIIYDQGGSAIFSGAITSDTNTQTVTTGENKCITNACEPGGYVNWVERWELISIFGGLSEYNGKQYYCVIGSPSKLWSLSESLKTSDGTTYKYLENAEIPVDCCPGQIQGNFICDKNTFKFVELTPEKLECKSDADCPGQGTDYLTDPKNPSNVVKYGCNSLGKCVEEDRKTVECNEVLKCTTGQCINGKCEGEGAEPVAKTDKTNCESTGGTWYTEKTEVCEGILCNIGITKPKVTETSYCKPKFNPILWLPYFIGFLLFLVAIVYIVKNNKKKKVKK